MVNDFIFSFPPPSHSHPPPPDDGDVEGSGVSAAEVVLHSLGMVVPLMSAELLKVSTRRISWKYFFLSLT